MHRPLHILLLTTFLLCLGAKANAQSILAGLYQSPKGVGATLMLDTGEGTEFNIFTLRTDFYGFWTHRTDRIGVFLSYTHDYSILRTGSEDFFLDLHAGAGASLGYALDYEKGFFSSFDRQLSHGPGGVIALTGNIGVRFDFQRRLSLDLGFSLDPGIHLRTDPRTGALLLSFYKNGIYRGYYPNLNLLYRF